jgi:sugar phosphate isomerase/epimerase
MKTFTRRDFLQSSTGFVAFAVTDKTLLYRSKEPLLSFSTLGCPDWTLDQILDFAVSHHYKGVEIRGIQRELDLGKSPHFNSDDSIKATKNKFRDKGLKIVGLGSSAAMHHRDETERAKALNEAKRFIDIAHKLGCPYIRVFPDKLPADRPKEETMKLISEGLSELGHYSNGTGVKVLMETHGDLLWSDDIVNVMNAVDNKNVGLIWDIANMWSVKKEDPAEVYGKLKKWIRHTHIKDMQIEGEKETYTLFGKGNVPIFEAIDILSKNGYDGYFSFEWEKLWHPEIEAPEIAIAQYSEVMKEHFKKAIVNRQ